MSLNEYIEAKRADDSTRLDAQLSVGRLTNVSVDSEQPTVSFVPLGGGKVKQDIPLLHDAHGDVYAPSKDTEALVIYDEVSGGSPIVLGFASTEGETVAEGERIFGHDATDSYIKYDADGNIILCPELDLLDCDGNEIGGDVGVSDSGTQVLASASDLNFSTNLTVTDDGDGTVSIEASGGGGSSDPTLWTVDHSGPVTSGDASTVTMHEIADGDALDVMRATMANHDVTAVPSGVSLRFVTADGAGATTDQKTILSGDGSTVYVDSFASKKVKYSNNSGSTQYIVVYLDNGHFGSGAGNDVDLFTELDVQVGNAVSFSCATTHGEGNGAFDGAVTLSDGRVVFPPYESSNVGVYDPSSSTYTSGTTHGEGAQAFIGGAQLSDGRVVFSPYESSNVGVYDPSSDTYTSGAAHGEGTQAFGGAVALSDDRVIFAPRSSPNVGIYDPSSDTYTSGAAHGEGTGATFLSAVVLGDDTVIFPPNDSANVGIYDPSTDTYTSGASHGEGGDAFVGGALLSDGRVIFAPYVSPNIGIYEPSTDTYTSGPAHDESFTAFFGATALDNDTVVFAPIGSDHVGIYDPEDNVYISGPAHGTGGQAFGEVSTVDGNTAIFSPFDADCIGEFEERT